MRIVRPHGATILDREHGRRVVPNSGSKSSPSEPRDPYDFAREQDVLVIAQWISAIDKIAAKPPGKKGATPEIEAFRRRLGDAAWAIIETRGLLPGLAGAEAARLRAVWTLRLTPYAGEGPWRGAKNEKPPRAKGRWFTRFAGDVARVEDVDVAAVAELIYEHLYLRRYRLVEGSAPPRSRGLIEERGASIRSCGLDAVGPGLAAWSADDLAAYVAPGDVAREIREAAKAREDGQPPYRVNGELAGEALSRHYARLFREADGTPMRIARARESYPGVFELHMAVKDVYQRLLKDHGKGFRADHHAALHRQSSRKVSTLLPGAVAQRVIITATQH